MILSSRRLKLQEKKVFRTLSLRIVLLILILLFVIYAGLPFMAKLILTLSSIRKEKPVTKNTNQVILFPPILDSLPEATNSSKITISGLGEREASVKIFINGKEKNKVLVDKDGMFWANNIFLYEGENIITAETLKEGKESSPSSPMIIIFKKNPPKIEIESPQEGEKFSWDEKEVTITGQIEPDSKLYINDRLVITDQYGKFHYTVTLNDGENLFKLKAIDAAGNETEMERKVTYSP